ncbi:hypothetical protein XENOCAPTIV_020011 [Xenoophorus captivus]|uniref:Uncharacterized protein n=1 Tax=Xenoophorus captivus TaxID=1517983 RepID=A0ABV0SJ33_9TELE
MAGSKLVLEGRVSIQSFILGLSVVLIPLIRTWFGHLDWVFDYLTETPGKIAICVHIAAINGLLLVIFRGPVYKKPPEEQIQLYGSSDVPFLINSLIDVIHINTSAKDPAFLTLLNSCSKLRHLPPGLDERYLGFLPPTFSPADPIILD